MRICLTFHSYRLFLKNKFSLNYNSPNYIIPPPYPPTIFLKKIKLQVGVAVLVPDEVVERADYFGGKCDLLLHNGEHLFVLLGVDLASVENQDKLGEPFEAGNDEIDLENLRFGGGVHPK